MHHRSISARQAQSLSKRALDRDQRRIGHSGHITHFTVDIGAVISCQWIQGDPSKKEIRTFGCDRFKCGAPTHNGSSWCEHHHSIVFIRKPLTETTS